MNSTGKCLILHWKSTGISLSYETVGTPVA